MLAQAAEMGGTNLSVGTRLPMGGEGGNYLLTFVPDTEGLLHWKHMKTLFNNSDYLCHYR